MKEGLAATLGRATGIAGALPPTVRGWKKMQMNQLPGAWDVMFNSRTTRIPTVS